MTLYQQATLGNTQALWWLICFTSDTTEVNDESNTTLSQIDSVLLTSGQLFSISVDARSEIFVLLDTAVREMVTIESTNRSKACIRIRNGCF